MGALENQFRHLRPVRTDYRDSGTTTPVGIENDKRPLGSFGRVASRMNCRYRAPVPFTPLVANLGVTIDWFAV